jgi:hypothetical protein
VRWTNGREAKGLGFDDRLDGFSAIGASPLQVGANGGEVFVVERFDQTRLVA